jgi:hypothetical protein
MKYKNLAYWKRQCYYWKRRALEAEKSIISVQKVEQHVKLNDLPIEIIWNIMEYLDIESAFKIGEIGKFSKKQVFKYHYFSLQESTGDFPFFCEFIRNLIGDKEELLEALLVNKRFKEIVEMEKVLALAANFGYMNVLTKLLEKNVDPTDDENLCLRLAAQNGHTEIVKELLKNPNVDPATCANYPILFASRNGHTEIVEILLKDDRVDPSDVDNWAIKKAAYLGHVDVVVLLTKDHRVRNKSGFEKFWRRYLKRFVNGNERR